MTEERAPYGAIMPDPIRRQRTELMLRQYFGQLGLLLLGLTDGHNLSDPECTPLRRMLNYRWN